MERKDIFDIGIENRKYVSKMRVKLGRDIENYNVVNYDLNRFRGLAIYDERDDKKNILLNKILTELDKNNSTYDLEFVIVGRENIPQYLSNSKNIKTFALNENVFDLVDYLSNILNNRKRIFKTRGVNSLYRYNEMADKKMPSVLVVIDGYDEFDKGARMLLDDMIMSTSYLFRCCGFSFIITSQNLNAISSTINSILTHKIVFKPKESFKLRRLLNGAYPKIDYGNIFYFTSEYEDAKTVDMNEILDISNKEFVNVDNALLVEDKQGAIDTCITLGKQFIFEFEKWYDSNCSTQRNCDVKKSFAIDKNKQGLPCFQMINLFESAKKECLHLLHRQPLSCELWDWFFSAGGDFRDFLNSPTNDKVVFYDKMTTQILSGKNIDEILKTCK